MLNSQHKYEPSLLIVNVVPLPNGEKTEVLLKKIRLPRAQFFGCTRHSNQGEYNVKSLKLIRDHHKNCKTHPK